MSDEKKTEEQIRHDIRRKFNFSEEKDKENIEKAVEMAKDRFTATQQKKKAQDELEEAKKTQEGKEEEPKGKEEANKPDYSLQDIRALSKVHDDDVERVTKFAKVEEISIAEALKKDDLKAILSSRVEKRKTAEAANTGGSKRGSTKVSDDQIVDDFENKGVIPESDEDIDKLTKGRMARKKAIAKEKRT